MKNGEIYYGVGPLLYCPADRARLSKSISGEKFGRGYSLALCLEDSINDNFVSEAENRLFETLREIWKAAFNSEFYIPKIFVRVREPGQIQRILDSLSDEKSLVKGFIAPKFSEENADSYVRAVLEANEKSDERIYFMPIFESFSIIDLRTRFDILYSLKEKIGRIEELVLNIRVGGNDLCHAFGLRRRLDESIHRIRPVSDILSDIITVYGLDYVVSGPVWEYYGGKGWESGLVQEIADDRLCGFVGKTVIHPKQIRVVNEAYKIPKSDFDDARAILDWERGSGNFVSGSVSGERMNELKTHTNWAERTMFMAKAFGVAETPV